jgi:hypothetical protein
MITILTAKIDLEKFVELSKEVIIKEIMEHEKLYDHFELECFSQLEDGFTIDVRSKVFFEPQTNESDEFTEMGISCYKTDVVLWHDNNSIEISNFDECKQFVEETIENYYK